MTLTLDLPDDVEARLIEASRRQGLGTAEFAVKLLSQHLPTTERREKLKRLLNSWIEDGDEVEQRETFEFLQQALDEDRTSNRKLFPPELKGTTW